MTSVKGVKLTPTDAAMFDTGVDVSLTIKRSELGACTPTYLAMLWHVLQAAPAEFDFKEVGDVAEAVGREIIRRWLRDVDPELYRQQGCHYTHARLTEFARWDGSQWVLKDEVFQAEAERRAAIEGTDT